MQIQVIPKLLPIYRNDRRYVVLHGGRGSGKSWTVADWLIAESLESPQTILCAREYQASIRDSSHKLIRERIRAYGIENLFTITDTEIRTLNGSLFIFKGLYRNEQGIRSIENVKKCWIEEAQSVTAESWNALDPSIRAEGSQIVCTINPHRPSDVIYANFVAVDRDDCLRIEINYPDNPFFPDVLRGQAEWDRKTNFDLFRHKWMGECLTHSEAQVFKGKWIVREFEIDNSYSTYYGLDFGFSQDPTALVEVAIKDRKLFVSNEMVGAGIEIDKLPAALNRIPDVGKRIITADSSRPETISYLRRNGFPRIKPSVKGKNSVVEGIEHIKGFEEIVIHPRCKTAIAEFGGYSYKTDKYSGTILDEPEDRENHVIDGIRYALEDVMRNRKARAVRNISL